MDRHFKLKQARIIKRKPNTNFELLRSPLFIRFKSVWKETAKAYGEDHVYRIKAERQLLNLIKRKHVIDNLEYYIGIAESDKEKEHLKTLSISEEEQELINLYGANIKAMWTADTPPEVVDQDINELEKAINRFNKFGWKIKKTAEAMTIQASGILTGSSSLTTTFIPVLKALREYEYYIDNFPKYAEYIENHLEEEEEAHGLQTVFEIQKAYIDKFNIKTESKPFTNKEKNRLNNFIKDFLIKNTDSPKNIFLNDLAFYGVSPGTHFISIILNTTGTNRTPRTNRNIKLTESHTDKGYTATYKSKDNTLILNIDNIDILTKKSDNNLKKLFIYNLQEWNRQNFDNDIVFNLSNLVDLGMYKSLESARKGFKSSMDKLLKITIEGETKQGQQSIKSEKGYIFIHRKIENNICTVTLSPKVNPYFVAQYFTCIPQWSYALNKKAFNTIEYIFYLARQNARSIDENGFFNISFNSINDYLGQPSPKETKHHTEYIIDPILNAITDIEEAQKNTDYKFTPIYDTNYINAVDFLQGYLKVELTGEAKLYFIERAKDQEREFKKTASIKEKALIRRTEKTLKI